MESVKNYVCPYDYKNCILVNKEWNSVFMKLNHVTELLFLLKKEDWFTKFTYNVILDRSLSPLQLLKCIITTLEIQKKPYNKLKYKYKLFNNLMIKTNPRLNFINLDGM